jgi:two-component sensor histidine kinase
MVRRALLPFSEHDHDRFRITGQDVQLDAGKALLLAMALHELGTNAVKYGALSQAGGCVQVRWELVKAAEAPSLLRFQWQETGGPPVTPPARKGFGSRMIERALQGQQGKACFDFAPEGLVVTLEMAV